MGRRRRNEDKDRHRESKELRKDTHTLPASIDKDRQIKNYNLTFTMLPEKSSLTGFIAHQ